MLLVAVSSCVPPDAAAPPPRVAHLLRPAQGGMVTQVRLLLNGADGIRAPENGLLAAPEEVVRRLANVWPPALRNDRDRTPLFVLSPPYIRPGDLLRKGDSVGRWARKQSARILHGHGLLWAPLFAAAAHRAGLPLVVTLHNLVPARETLSFSQRIALRVSLGRAARLIAVSDAVAASVAPALSGSRALERVRVVRNGIAAAEFASADPEKVRAEVRRELNLFPRAPLILCLARLSPEKGIGDLIAAAARLKTPGAQVLVAGGGTRQEALEREAREADAPVRFLGQRDDIPRLLAAADVVCVPSREEGLGMAALEAMAAGLPVVATRIGGLIEVVVSNETGVLVPPAAPEELAAALDRLLQQPDSARSLGEAGRRRVRSCFSSERMVCETEMIYREALESR